VGEFAGLFCATRSAFLDHERAKSELKALMPEDAKEVCGHGVRAKRSKSGAVRRGQTSAVVRRTPATAPTAVRRQRPVVKTIRLRDKEHCRFVGTQPCVVCGRMPAEGIIFASPNPER
jgi:hypothetical protein